MLNDEEKNLFSLVFLELVPIRESVILVILMTSLSEKIITVFMTMLFIDSLFQEARKSIYEEPTHGQFTLSKEEKFL